MVSFRHRLPAGSLRQRCKTSFIPALPASNAVEIAHSIPQIIIDKRKDRLLSTNPFPVTIGWSTARTKQTTIVSDRAKERKETSLDQAQTTPKTLRWKSRHDVSLALHSRHLVHSVKIVTRYGDYPETTSL
jgi:hypothetical protein